MAKPKDFSHWAEHFLMKYDEMRRDHQKAYRDANVNRDEDNRRIWGVEGITNGLLLTLSLPDYKDSRFPNVAKLKLNESHVSPTLRTKPYDLIYAHFNSDGRLIRRGYHFEPADDALIGGRIKTFRSGVNWKGESVRDAYDAITQLFELMATKDADLVVRGFGIKKHFLDKDKNRLPFPDYSELIAR